MNAVELQDVRFHWPGQPDLLEIPAFSVARGERVFLMGPSGSGKSTLLGLMAGVLQPVRGTVRVLETDLGALSPAARDRFRGEHVGFIFQMFNLIPYLSILENVLLPLQFCRRRAARFSGTPSEEAGRLLAALGLPERSLQGRPVNHLSIGQQQRVAAARALLGRPELLIADEPTSALDADNRAAFLDLLMAECERHGTSLLFVSHDAALAQRFDHSVALRDINAALAPEAT